MHFDSHAHHVLFWGCILHIDISLKCENVRLLLYCLPSAYYKCIYQITSQTFWSLTTLINCRKMTNLFKNRFSYFQWYQKKPVTQEPLKVSFFFYCISGHKANLNKVFLTDQHTHSKKRDIDCPLGVFLWIKKMWFTIPCLEPI